MNTLNDLSAALPTMTDEDEAVMQTRLEQGVSKSALRRALARNNKCMTCPFHGANMLDLRKHLRKNKDHFYGVDRLSKEKKDFIERLLKAHASLAENGVQHFKDVKAKHYAGFKAFEKREYEDLLTLSFQQVHL